MAPVDGFQVKKVKKTVPGSFPEMGLYKNHSFPGNYSTFVSRALENFRYQNNANGVSDPADPWYIDTNLLFTIAPKC